MLKKVSKQNRNTASPTKGTGNKTMTEPMNSSKRSNDKLKQFIKGVKPAKSKSPNSSMRKKTSMSPVPTQKKSATAKKTVEYKMNLSARKIKREVSPVPNLNESSIMHHLNTSNDVANLHIPSNSNYGPQQHYYTPNFDQEQQ